MDETCFREPCQMSTRSRFPPSIFRHCKRKCRKSRYSTPRGPVTLILREFTSTFTTHHTKEPNHIHTSTTSVPHPHIPLSQQHTNPHNSSLTILGNFQVTRTQDNLHPVNKNSLHPHDPLPSCRTSAPPPQPPDACKGPTVPNTKQNPLQATEDAHRRNRRNLLSSCADEHIKYYR